MTHAQAQYSSFKLIRNLIRTLKTRPWTAERSVNTHALAESCTIPYVASRPVTANRSFPSK